MRDWIQQQHKEQSGYVRELAAAVMDTSQNWRDYADACLAKEHGLRGNALQALDRFISTMEAAPVEERRRFVGWLMPKGRNTRR